MLRVLLLIKNRRQYNTVTVMNKSLKNRAISSLYSYGCWRILKGKKKLKTEQWRGKLFLDIINF